MTQQPETMESLRTKLEMHTHLNEVYSLTIQVLCEQLPAGAYEDARRQAMEKLGKPAVDHVAKPTEINDNLNALDG